LYLDRFRLWAGRVRAALGRRIAHALALLAAALLVGCAVGPNYVRPAAETPVTYKELDGWKMAQPKDDALRGAWWRVFADPEPDALEERVSLSNQNLVVAEAQFRQA